MKVWKGILKNGCTPDLRGPERNSVMIVNGVSSIMLVVVTLFLTYYIVTGVSIWANWLPAYPFFLTPLFLNRRQNYQLARTIFFWGALALIGAWCFSNRRNGAEYGLIVLSITAPLIFKRNGMVYLASASSIAVLVVYKIFDEVTPFSPNPTFNYYLTPKLIFGAAVAMVVFEVMVFRSLANRYHKKLKGKYEEVQTVLHAQKLTEAELQVTNEELQAANESLSNLTEQLDWMVRQKTMELQHYLNAIDIHLYSAITDVSGTIIKVNEPLINVAGYSQEELLGGNFRILNSGHHPPAFYQDLYANILNGKTWRNETCNKAKDGSIFWIDQVILPVKNEKGELKYFLMLGLPITERKEMEEERLKTMHMLESVAHRASHEVRAPLARILGLTYLLSNGMIKPEEITQITNQIAVSSKELDDATRELTTFVTDHHFSVTNSDN